MQFKTIFSLFFICLFVVIVAGSCGQKEATTNADSTETKAGNTKEVEAVYESCTFYTGSTKYVFKTEKGEAIEFSALNEGMDDQQLSAKMPANMIRDAEDTLATSDANPKMVGKKFKIIYNQSGEVAEVKQIM